MTPEEKKHAKYIGYYHNRNNLPEGYETLREESLADARTHLRYYGKYEGDTLKVESVLISIPHYGGKTSQRFAEMYKNDEGYYIMKTSNDGIASGDAFAFKINDDGSVLVAGTRGNNGKHLEKYYGITIGDVVNYIDLLESHREIHKVKRIVK